MFLMYTASRLKAGAGFQTASLIKNDTFAAKARPYIFHFRLNTALRGSP